MENSPSTPTALSRPTSTKWLFQSRRRLLKLRYNATDLCILIYPVTWWILQQLSLQQSSWAQIVKTSNLLLLLIWWTVQVVYRNGHKFPLCMKKTNKTLSLNLNALHTWLKLKQASMRWTTLGQFFTIQKYKTSRYAIRSKTGRRSWRQRSN